MKPFHKLFAPENYISNVGNSEGAKKGWDSRKSVDEYNRLATMASMSAVNLAAAGNHRTAGAAADRSSTFAEYAARSAMLPDSEYNQDHAKSTASQAHSYASRAHEAAAMFGTNRSRDYQKHHELMAKYRA